MSDQYDSTDVACPHVLMSEEAGLGPGSSLADFG